MKFPIVITTAQKIETQIAQQTMQACEQVANEMGAEVHDDLIQKLTVFTLYLDRLERAAHHPDEVKDLLLKMRTDFKEMAASVRRISRKLMPEQIESQSFQKSIELLCQNLDLPSQGKVHFESGGVEKELSELAKMYLYRVVQELIHNAFKHSAAWHVWVRIRWQENLTLEVEDDGTAFSSMEKSVAQLNAKYNTLRMRTQAIGAKIRYTQGQKGLIARIDYSPST